MIGNSPAMREIFEQIRRFATCDAPVLIAGESGTGKELVAHAIHEHSARAGARFVAINCAALPASLIASELFGYEKGAFTGASARKRGMIEVAHRGTLFLDEIGDMPIDLQGHLLRFLQESEITRVGGHEPVRVNVRIIAATNVQLQDAITAGRLREDLFYRLNVLSMDMPPLREREGDVEVMAYFFLRKISKELGLDVQGFTPQALAAIRHHTWPGNVRELIATIRRAVVMCNDLLIDVDDLHLSLPRTYAPVAGHIAERRPPPRTEGEREMLLRVLEENRSNVTRASRVLKVSRVTFYRMLHRNNLMLGQRYVMDEQHNGATS